MKKSNVIATLALILATLHSSCLADKPVFSRSFPACGFVGGQIYCYGGDISADATVYTVEDQLYRLNVSNFIGQTSDSMSNHWNSVNPSVPFLVGFRRTPNFAVLADGNRFLIQGGYNVGNFHYINQTVIFDTTMNQWQSGASYKEPDRGVRQIYQSGVVVLPNNKVSFYGGIEQLANTSIPQVSASGAVMPYDSANTSVIGFASLESFTPASSVWNQVTPQAGTPINYYPNTQTATLNPATNIIYYLGGRYYTPPNNNNSIMQPLHWAMTFNSNTGAWNNMTLTGNVPATRLYHTANLPPNSDSIILYGGSPDGEKASLDYCFTLNMTNNVWTKQDNVNVPSTFSGPRYQHAAVLVNTTLFILFGRGLDGGLSPSMLTIDVTNISDIRYSVNYGVSNSDGTPITGDGNSLSKGALGGIIAGCAIAAIILAAVIFLCIRRRQRKEQSPIAQQEGELMHVDWDKIDDQYREMPMPTGYSPPLSNSVTTTADSPELNSSYNHKKDSGNAGNAEQHPNTFNQYELNAPNQNNFTISTVKPNADGDKEIHSAMKPDGYQ